VASGAAQVQAGRLDDALALVSTLKKDIVDKP
jgi:hypothetical protein